MDTEKIELKDSEALPAGLDFVEFSNAYAQELSSNSMRSYLSELILTANYKNLDELRSYVSKHNQEMEKVLDKVIFIMKEAGHIDINGQEIILKNPFLKCTNPKNLKKYLTNLFEKAVYKVLDDHEQKSDLMTYETAQILSFPSDDKTLQQLKSAADEYKKNLNSIMKQANDEQRSSDSTAYAGLVTAKLTPEVF